jgi:hypothetical protein
MVNTCIKLCVCGCLLNSYTALPLKALSIFVFIVTDCCRQVSGPLFEKTFSDGLVCRLAVFLTKEGTSLAVLGLEGLKHAE